MYPLENAWAEQIDEANHILGGGFNVTFDNITFDLSYSYLHADSEFEYEFASSSAFLNLFTEDEAGEGFPDQLFKHQRLQANLRWFIREGTNLRLLYRYEKEKIRDFHYEGLTEPIVGANIFLAAVPENYSAHVLGLMLETNF